MGKTVRKESGLSADLAEFVQNLARSLFDPYRPEQHYMRGPGPKWHAKHDRVSVSYRAVPGAGPGPREALILGLRPGHRRDVAGRGRPAATSPACHVPVSPHPVSSVHLPAFARAG